MSILCAYRYGIVGGVSTQFLLRQRVLRSSGFDCHLFFAQDNGLRSTLNGRAGVHFGADISLRRLVRRLRPDVAVVVDSPELIAPLRGWTGRPRVYIDVHTTTALGLTYLQDISLSGLAGVLCPTRYNSNLVRERRPDAEPLVVPNLIEVGQLADHRGREESTLAVPEFVWVGKLDYHKNWRMALVWGKLLRQALGEIKLIMVGGYTASDERVDDFMRLADELDLMGSFGWIDRIDNAELPALYRRVAASGGAMLVTSRDESFGMAVAEALTCACPVIANDLPVFREVFPESPLFQRVDVWQPSSFLLALERLQEGLSSEDVQFMRHHLAARYGRDAFLSAMKPVLKGARV